MTNTNHHRILKFNARYLAVLASVIPKNDVRYYLNGFFTTPHESGIGAYLVATDGHHMVIIYDETAETNGDWICQVTPKLLATAKKKGTGTKSLYNGAGTVHFINNTVFVANKNASQMQLPAGVFEINGKTGEINENILHCEYSKPIEGKYPDFKRVIPEKADEDQIPLFNPTYLDFADSIKKQLGDPRVNAAKLYGNGPDKSLIVRFPMHPEILAIIMPMREDKSDKIKAIPDWLVRLNKEEKETEAA